VSFGEDGSLDAQHLSSKALNSLVVFNSKKVLKLEKELAKSKINERRKCKESLSRQKADSTFAADAKVGAALAEQKRDLEMKCHKKLREITGEQKSRHKEVVKTLVSAHSDHLKDILDVHEDELDRKYANKIDEASSSVRSHYNQQLAALIGRLNGLEGALRERAEVQKSSNQSDKLWLASQALRRELKSGSRCQLEQVSLKPELEAVKSAAGNGNSFVSSVLDTINPRSVSIGVSSEEAVKRRFQRVEKIARRVALIGDEGGSLFRFALSWIQSLLIIRSPLSELPLQEVLDEPIDLDKLNAFDVLARAKLCIERDDLEMALRYMNLLSGAPRIVASDWLEETRRLLEARLAADALLAYAVASSVRAL